MKVNTALALAFVNAAVPQLKKEGNKVDHTRWVARHVADRAMHTTIGTVNVPAIVVNSEKGRFIRG